jgi:hypothetical protein
MIGDQHIGISAQVVERIGFYAFVVMTSLILICIAFGFYAVIDKYKQPTWTEACIAKGGVPVQLEKSMFDCKGI